MRFELWVNFYWSRVKATRNCLFIMGCFLLFTICYPLSSVSQTRLDSAAIEVRYPSKEKVERFKSDRDYQYNTDTIPPENPLAKFWYWLTQKLNGFFRSAAYKSVWQYVILVGIAALAIWLLWKAEFLGGVFGKKAKKGLLEYEVLTENIHEIDFDQSIEEAVIQRNFRLAIRLYYLKHLKQLSDKELIDWKPTKTNRSYLYELSDGKIKNNFENLTRQFEYVWYGDFNISEQEFQELKTGFQVMV